LNYFANHGICQENQSIVFDCLVADFTERFFQVTDRVIATGEQIKIARRSVRLIGPQVEQDCSLHDEPIVVHRLTDAIQQTLQREATEH